MLFIILLIELAILYSLSQHISMLLFRFALMLFRHRSIAISITTLIFFPGTVVHELAHLFTAEILGVRTGKLSLVPENLEEEDLPAGRQEIQAGSVQIAKSDPLRRYLIGIAPLFFGLVFLTALSYFLRRPLAILQGDALQNAIISSIEIYLLFAISNSMFSSKEDLKGFMSFTIVTGLLIAAAYASGIRVMLTGQALDVTMRMTEALVQSLGIVLAVNGVLLLTIRVLLVLSRKLRK